MAKYAALVASASDGAVTTGRRLARAMADPGLAVSDARSDTVISGG
jgi:Pyruvate/2-oxoacid:ferredoxin oxidoreductase gamma subunit